MNESAVGFCCNTVNTVNIFPEIISSKVIEVGLGSENKIIQINLPHKKYALAKKNERNIHERLSRNTENTRKKMVLLS